MMDLLDLPPEIFQKIIANHVKSVGVSKAWRRRDVCKTFAAFLSEECFGRQPMTKYADPAARRLLCRHAELFFSYRCRSLYGAPKLLPSLVRNVVEKFMTTTSQTSETDRAAYTDRVCHAIVNHLPKGRLFQLATKPTLLMCDKFASDPVEIFCLTIAILMKDKELVSHYLSQGVSVWNSTEVFDMPLTVAAKLGAVDFVAQLLKHAKSSLTKSAKAKSMMQLRYTLDITTTSGHWDVAIIIIDWWFQHLRKPVPNQIASWVMRATSAPTTEFLHRIMDHNHTPATKRQLVECLYYSHMKTENDAMSRLAGALIDRNLLDPSKFYLNRSAAVSSSGSLLTLAVERSDIKLATGYLKLGLSPNGLRNPEGNLEHPLVRAVEKSDEAMVKFLLDHDADPKPAQRWIVNGPEKPVTSFLEQLRRVRLRGKRTTESIAALIRQAAKAKDRRRK